MEYRILGPFDVLDEGTSVHLGGGRQRAFLALLLINANQVVSTDRIIDQLWGEEAPETVANVIQVYVSRLRKALEPDRPKGAESSVLMTRRPGYLLNVDPAQIDAHRFLDLSKRGRDAMADNAMGIASSLLTQAMELWHGDVLADLAFEDFARGEIERLSEARLVAIESFHEAQLALGQHESLVGDLESIVLEYPLREQLWAHLMVALYRSGRQAEALRAYRRAADILIEELGIDPSPLLQELEEQVLMQDPALDAPAVSREPLPVSLAQSAPPLIGRASQVAAVDDGFELLERGRSVLLTISGDPGMGVARMLAEIDRSARSKELEVRTARAHPTSVTQAGDIIGQLGNEDGETPIVAIVANAHHCDPTSLAALRRSIIGGDRPIMVALGVNPVDGRQGQGLAQMTRAVAEVGTVIPLELRRLTQADCERVMASDLAETVMRLTGGYPLDVSQLLSGLRDEGLVDWDTARIRSLGPVPESVAPFPAQKIKELPKPQRRLVEACALAGVPIPLAAAGCLIEGTDDDALEMIETLVAGGYLDEAPEGVSASTTLGSARLVEQFGDTRRAAVYSDLARCFEGRASKPTVGWFALHSSNNETASRLLGDAGMEAVDQGHFGEAQQLLEGAIEAKSRLGQTSDEEWGRLHLGIAQCHRLAGWSDLAAAALDEAIPLLSGDALVDALGWAAQVADDHQRVAESEWWVARAEREAIVEEAPDKLGSLLSLRARILNRLAFASESDHCAEKAEQLLRASSTPRQRFLVSYNRAWVTFDRGEMRHAEAAFAALVDQASGDGPLADLYAWHGRSLFWLGEVDRALETLNKAAHLGRKTGDGGPVFLAALGRSEGALLFDRADVAAEAIDEFTGHVLHQLPAWENVARYLSARLALLKGDMQTASHEVANALELSAIGPGGRRWWLACRSLQMRIDDEAGPELDQLIDEARQAQWRTAEVRLGAWAAEARADTDLAASTSALALEHGMAVSAAHLIEAVGAWESSVGQRVAEAVRSVLAKQDRAWVDGTLALVQPNR